MARKFAFLFSAFIFLVGANLVIARSLISEKQLSTTQKVFDEIASNNPYYQQFVNPPTTDVLSASTTETTIADGRVANLKNFFRTHNSPLYDYADLIVQVSDEHQFDYRLIPAIAMQESTVCQKIPPGSHNCWGWGIYGDKITRFDSYDEAIRTVAEGLRKEYIDKGLLTASAIMEKYTPSSNGSWQAGVNTILKRLE